MQKPIIELKDVWKIYQMGEVQVPAVKGVTLEIEKGEFLAISGSSGSGKSTIMNQVGCLDLPTQGKVLLDGEDIAAFTESQLAQVRGQKIGFIFQQFNLIQTLTALENVMLPLEFQNVDSSIAEEKALKLLKLVGLGDRVGHLPSQLSGGEMQRVAIARSLAVDPEILLADEPTGNLDSKTGLFIMETLKRIHAEEGKTIIMVTHNPRLESYAERIVHLKDGQVEGITSNRKRRGGKRR